MAQGVNQAQADAIAQAAGAAAANAITETKINIRVDAFFGEDRDTKTPEQWAETLDRALDVNGWNQAAAANVAKEQLRGAAHLWVFKLKQQGGDKATALNEWRTMKPLFIKRFQKGKTPTDKVGLVSSLIQKANENEADFADRVEVGVWLMNEEKYGALAGPNLEVKQEAYNQCMSHMAMLHYMNGLKPEVRRSLNQSCPAGGRSMEETMEAASQVGEALRMEGRQAKSLAQLAGIEAEVAAASGGLMGPPQPPPPLLMKGATTKAAAEAQIAALQRQAAKTFGNAKKTKTPAAPAGRGGGGGGGAPSGATGGAAGGAGRGGGAGGNSEPGYFKRMKALPIQAREWICCNRCGKWGQHFAYECKLSAQQILGVNKDDRTVIPTGPAFDVQFQGN